MSRQHWAKAIWIATALWFFVVVGSLHYGWLNRFSFDTSHTELQTQGVDFFPVERAWLNLTDGRSEFDTFHSHYGPRATWLIYHPALALVLGPLLMAFTPWTAYAVWTVIALLLMAASAALIVRTGKDPLRRALVALLLLGAFPTYLMLYVGNVQALLTFAVVLVLASIIEMQQQGSTRRNQAMLLAGLLISLFSKPVVLAMLPLLFILSETRRTALKATGIYLAVSLIFLVVPGLNPESLTWAQRFDLATHPAVIAQTMNVFTNGFVVTQPMKDNSIHWLAMLGLTDYRFLHIDVYSLPALLDGWLHTHTPDALYRIPGILILELTLLVALIRDKRDQLEAALTTLMAISLAAFLSYGLVWEYHFTAILPVAAFFLMRQHPGRMEQAILAMATLTWLPSLYIFISNRDLSLLSVQTLLHAERVLPLLAVFCLLMYRATKIALTSPGGLGGSLQPNETPGAPGPDFRTRARNLPRPERNSSPPRTSLLFLQRPGQIVLRQLKPGIQHQRLPKVRLGLRIPRLHHHRDPDIVLRRRVLRVHLQALLPRRNCLIELPKVQAIQSLRQIEIRLPISLRHLRFGVQGRHHLGLLRLRPVQIVLD
jgi:hypothetical protein